MQLTGMPLQPTLSEPPSEIWSEKIFSEKILRKFCQRDSTEGRNDAQKINFLKTPSVWRSHALLALRHALVKTEHMQLTGMPLQPTLSEPPSEIWSENFSDKILSDRKFRSRCNFFLSYCKYERARNACVRRRHPRHCGSLLTSHSAAHAEERMPDELALSQLRL